MQTFVIGGGRGVGGVRFILPLRFTGLQLVEPT